MPPITPRCFALVLAIATLGCRDKHAHALPTTAGGSAHIQDCLADGLITGTRAGSIRIGMPADSVRLHCTVMHEVDVPTYGARLMLVSVHDDTLRVWTVRNKVDRIDVGSPMLRTSDSIRVGAPITGLLRHEQLEGGVGDGHDVFVVYVPTGALCGLSFVLDPQSALALSRAQNAREELRTIKPTPSISAVWVIGDRQC